MQAIKAARKSLVSGFDFMKPHGVAPSVFNNMTPEAAKTLAANLNFKLETYETAGESVSDPISALLSNLIHRGASPLAVATENGKVTGATRVLDTPAISLDSNSPREFADLQAQLAQLGGASALMDRIQRLEAEVATLKGGTGDAPK